MTHHYLEISHRPMSLLHPLDEEMLINANKNYLFELDYLGVMGLSGEKSAEFLNGQISCNVNSIDSAQMKQGALCNLKGRVQALMDVIEWNGIKLVLPNDLAENITNTLSKTAMFSRVKLTQLTDYKIYGFCLQNIDDLLPFNLARLPSKHESYGTDFMIYAITDKLFILLVPPLMENELLVPFEKSSQTKGSLAWHKLQLMAGLIEIYPDTHGELLPHRIGLQHTGHLDFNKGCYKGQEIIARTHYRAKLKHELKQFIVSNIQLTKAGTKLFSLDKKKEIGEIVDYCFLSQDCFLISTSILKDHPQQCLIDGHDDPIELNPVATH